MEQRSALRGMANVSYWADDMHKARDWYSRLFGTTPYFQKPDAVNPSYIEFRVGDYLHEVGIIDKQYMPNPQQQGPGGAILYWHVDDLDKALEEVIAMGATPFQPVTKWGEGFVTASVIDPFGNVIGLMYNKHYLDILNNKMAYGNP